MRVCRRCDGVLTGYQVGAGACVVLFTRRLRWSGVSALRGGETPILKTAGAMVNGEPLGIDMSAGSVRGCETRGAFTRRIRWSGVSFLRGAVPIAKLSLVRVGYVSMLERRVGYVYMLERVRVSVRETVGSSIRAS